MSPAPLRRKRSTFNPFLAVLLGVLGVIGVLLTLHFTEHIELPYVDTALGREVKAQETNVRTVPVMITARDLQPGQAVRRADVWDAAIQNFKVVRVHEDDVREDWILKWSDIEGRVMAHAKSKDKAFKETDFLPKGTRPGVASLVPQGMRMVTIPKDRVVGLEALHYQDRFDLVAHREIDEKLLDEAQKALQGLSKDTWLEIESLRGATHRRLVACDAMRLPALASGDAGSKQPIAVAVAASEVPGLLQALEAKDGLFCVVYSGNEEEWARRAIEVDVDPEEKLERILAGTSEMRVHDGDEVRTIRVKRYRDPETSN